MSIKTSIYDSVSLQANSFAQQGLQMNRTPVVALCTEVLCCREVFLSGFHCIDRIVCNDNYLNFVKYNPICEFGNLITGTIKTLPKSDTSVTTLLHAGVDNIGLNLLLNDCLQRDWSLDNIGTSGKTTTKNQDNILDIFKSSVITQNGRFDVALPWTENHASLQSNMKMTYPRLNSNLTKWINNCCNLEAYERQKSETIKVRIY